MKHDKRTNCYFGTSHSLFQSFVDTSFKYFTSSWGGLHWECHIHNFAVDSGGGRAGISIFVTESGIVDGAKKRNREKQAGESGVEGVVAEARHGSNSLSSLCG